MDNFGLSLLTLISFFASFITGLVGIGGGLLLLVIFPNFIPAHAVIPVHGAVQLSSNFSRFLAQINKTHWNAMILFGLGSLLGASIGGVFLGSIDFSLFPLVMSAIILSILWTKVDKVLSLIPGKYFSLGGIQTALALYVGAVGPLSTSLLHKDGYSLETAITTNAGINSIVNILKIIVYVASGFLFSDYLSLIICMSVAAMFGSYFGVKVRLNSKISPENGQIILKWLITLLCFKNIVSYLSTVA